MKAKYRRIGDYVELVDERNVELKVDTLLGVSINKYFMPSVANIIGTDLSNYKIIKKHQFACSLMQVSRDEKIPIDCLTDYDIAIVSPAYAVFEVSDTTKLLPQYLSLWFKRSEFDREASFLGVGGIRGSMAWDDFCNMEFPLPSIERQKAVVKAYKTVTDRIKLKRKINEKLEEMAGSVFKSWFIDFDTNIDEEYTEFEYGKYPPGWSISPMAEVVDIRDGTHDSPRPVDNGYSLVTSAHLLPYGVDFATTYNINEKEYNKANMRSKVNTGDILFSMIGTVGTIAYVPYENINFAIKNVGLFRTSQIPNLAEYVLLYLKSTISRRYIMSNLAGSTQTYASLTILRNIPFILPPNEIILKFKKVVKPLISEIIINSEEIVLLNNLHDLLLSKFDEKRMVTKNE